MKKRIPLIIDVDTGIDDAVALIFAASLKNLDLKLVTTTYGNVDLNKVNDNTMIIMEDIGSDVQVVSGSAKPLQINDFNISAHGKNGLGNYHHPVKVKISNEDYIEAIHRTVNSNKDVTNIVVCGPLTNMANFITKHPEDNDKIRLIIITGLLEIDKQHPYLNFNITKDTKAFKIVIKKYHNVVFVPSDMGHISYIPTEDFYKTADCGQIGKILASIYPYHMDRTIKNGAALHDLCGVAWLSNPELFVTQKANTKFKKTPNGYYVDFDCKAKNTNSLITTSINVKKFHQLYYKTLKSLK